MLTPLSGQVNRSDIRKELEEIFDVLDELPAAEDMIEENEQALDEVRVRLDALINLLEAFEVRNV